MKSNFEFLKKYWPVLAQIGAAAESYLSVKLILALIGSGLRVILHPIGFSVHLSGLFLEIICYLHHICDIIFLRRTFVN